MAIFTESLLKDVRRLPGANHAFLRDICDPRAASSRTAVERMAADLPDDVGRRVADRLTSIDNRRFFQGFAELAAVGVLRRGGWKVDGLANPGDLVRATRPDGHTVNVMVLSFVHAARPEMDGAAINQLERTLARVHTRLRFCVYVRKWLPARFNPEPVRQAVQLWLREVEAGRWEGRFAAYEDDAVVLEFGLSGGKVPSGISPVLMTLGPFMGGRVVQVVERRLVYHLDAYRAGALGLEPLLIMAVGDQPWTITPGYMREFLYGKPKWMASVEHGGANRWEAGISDSREPCLFKDPLYRNVVGVCLVDRDPAEPFRFGGWALSNINATTPLEPFELPLRTLAQDREEEDGVKVVRWFNRRAEPVDLGAG